MIQNSRTMLVVTSSGCRTVTMSMMMLTAMFSVVMRSGMTMTMWFVMVAMLVVPTAMRSMLVVTDMWL